jgi:hypothetical protein
MMDRENCALFVVGWLRVDEFRIPVATGPCALALWAKERRGLRKRQVDDQIEGGGLPRKRFGLRR